MGYTYRFIQDEHSLYVHEHEAFPMMSDSGVRGGGGSSGYVYNDSPMERGVYVCRVYECTMLVYFWVVFNVQPNTHAHINLFFHGLLTLHRIFHA